MRHADDLVRALAVGEGAMGVALVVVPGLIARLLFGGDVAGAGQAMARIAGMALLGLAIACWPLAGKSGGADRARAALLVYSALATIYLSALAVGGELRGVLLWPAAVVHLVVTVLLARGRSTPPGAAR